MAKASKVDESGGLFDYLKAKFRKHNDGDLARFIETHPSIVSEIRNGKRVINEVMLVRICNLTGMSLKKVQALIAYREK